MRPEYDLITGGAGFIGSHLAEELLGRGRRVHVLDDLSTGSRGNIEHLLGHPDFSFTHGSCADIRLVARLIDRAQAVYHLAAAVGVQLVVESPVRTIETNVGCTEVVLSQAVKGNRPVLIASTSEVYGKSPDVPFRESGDLVLGATAKGRWSYACSKMIDEFLALAYHRERGLPTVVVRLFNTVGPRQTGRYGMVLPTLVGQALAERPLTVFGDGTQRRCFCHVKDVVSALVELMEGGGHFGEVFNVGSTEEVTIRELAGLVKELSGSGSDIVTIPYAEAYEDGFEDMLRRVPDTSKIRAAIGWQPTHDLREILGDVIDREHSAVLAR
jgi:UDP-glucose 4-epimerase